MLGVVGSDVLDDVLLIFLHDLVCDMCWNTFVFGFFSDLMGEFTDGVLDVTIELGLL